MHKPRLRWSNCDLLASSDSSQTRVYSKWAECNTRTFRGRTKLTACLYSRWALSFCRLFVTPFASLLQDHETEVRAATIKDISSFVDLVGPPTFASEVMPYVLALLQDVNLVSGCWLLNEWKGAVYPR